MKIGESKDMEVSAASAFVSTSESVAAVSQKRTIVAKKAGTANIYAYKNGAVVVWWKIKVVSEQPKIETRTTNKENFTFVSSGVCQYSCHNKIYYFLN